MRPPSLRQLVPALVFYAICVGALIFACGARADQVEMVNGDRYVGHVLSLNTDTLTIQNEFLGAIKLPRARISTIALDSSAAPGRTNSVRVAPGISRSTRLAQVSGRIATNMAPDFTATMQGLKTNSSVINQVQQQFLAGAGPEATTKFNDLVAGLMSGKIGVNELRAEAKSTLEQAKSARKELGEEGGSSMDSYLAILESFLKESEPASAPTNSAIATVPGIRQAQKPSAEE